ncbi:MAG: putative conserved integral rane protein [Thermoleophilia bacterium]|nr:putative conserved integral rane protein [Thermoleophilia bacterium]
MEPMSAPTDTCADACCSTSAPATSVALGTLVAPTRRRQLARRARHLSWASFVLVGGEAIVGITAGIAAMSWALVGFGLGSLIEGMASLVIVWRFQEHRIDSVSAERIAQRLVSAQFFLLAPYISYEAIGALLDRERPEESLVGIALAVACMISMPLLGRAKIAVARELGSSATKGEGQQNLLCAYMATALLIGLVANAAWGIWWLDPVAALLMAGVAVKQGVDAWRGHLDCC